MLCDKGTDSAAPLSIGFLFAPNIYLFLYTDAIRSSATQYIKKKASANMYSLYIRYNVII